MRNLVTLLLALSLSVFAADKESDKLETRKWLNSPPSVQAFFGNQLSSDTFMEARAPLRQSLIERLTNERFVELSPLEARKYSDTLVDKSKPSNHYYLLRALRSGAGGAFSIFSFEDSLYVLHGTFDRDAELQKTAVILALSHRIADVYVGVESAR